MGRISALTELTSLASDDYLVVLDSSANIAKKITVANAFGITDFGWTATGESWTYASWTSATRIGTITVPTDATVKYTAGMRIKITQSTGGTKYGIITKVAATLLTVFFPSGTTFNNEAITSPQYSIAKVPLGFNADPLLWELSSTLGTTTTQNSPTNGTWYNLGSHSLDVGIGAWLIGYQASYQTTHATTANETYVTLSTANNSSTDSDLGLREYESGDSGAGLTLGPLMREKLKLLTSATTFYLNFKTTTTTTSIQNRNATDETSRIYARCAYL